jgi:hypothetical protein
MTGLPGPHSIDPYLRLALDCVHREYPNQVALRLGSDADLKPPRTLTPAFFGCYDWHSAVHAHFLLARAVRLGSPESARAASALGKSLTAENVARELLFLEGRPGFERPYGLAWLLALHAELATGETDDSITLGRTLAPLATLAAGRMEAWLAKLSHPIRSGVHSQTAFAMGLCLDRARAVGDRGAEAFLVRRARDYHEGDRDLPLHLEPSGEDFFSPSLGVADLMARVLERAAFGQWLRAALPSLGAAPLTPVTVTDPDDGRLAHLDGLNLSRAWMLHAIAAALDDDDPSKSPIARMAATHERAGLAAIGGRPYAGTHWLGTFAAYLLTHGARSGPELAGTR